MSRLKIDAELAKSGILTANLHGVRTVLQREFGLKHFPISMDDKVKAQMENDKNDTYPYGWMVPSDLQGVRDQINTRAVQRFGARVGTYGATRNTSRVGYIFPVRLGIEIHIVTDDANKALRFSELFAILSGMQSILSFDVRFGQQFFINTRLEIPDTITIPFADTGDTTKPGGIELTMQMVVHTYAGFFHDKASVYAMDPIIGMATEEDGEVTDFSDLPSWLPEGYADESQPNEDPSP